MTRDCFGDPVELSAVCNTSVNRCGPSAGIGPVCAIAPDGGVFVAVMGDNNMLTATGWRFDQGHSFPNPAAIPAEQFATPDDTAACNRAWCALPCPGVQPEAYSFFCRDAGKGDAESGE
jgi:hypothetical protein